MASTPILQISPADSALNLVLASYPYVKVDKQTSDTPQAPSKLVLSSSETISGTNTILAWLSSKVFPETTYSEVEQQQINQWLTLSATQLASDQKAFLTTLNDHLKTKTTLLGDKFSIADVAVYTRLKDTAAKWTDEERTGKEDGGWRYIVRYLDFVQNSPQLGLHLAETDKLAVDKSKVVTEVRIKEAVKEKKPKAEGAAPVAEAGKKAKKAAKGAVEVVVDQTKEAAAAVAGAVEGKPAKKEKAKKEKKPAAPPKAEAALSPALLDLRVGHILHCEPHPDAESLYISTISALDPADSPYITAPPYKYCPADKVPAGTTVRTVCSGLRKYIALEDMQDRKVVLVANLKPANLRSVKSQAMVLAASPAEGEKDVVELVNPPADAPVGAALVFEGYEEGEPEAQLNPKKKIMETLTPGLGTNAQKEVVFDGAKVKELGENQKVGRLVLKDKGAAAGLCTVASLSNALVK